MGKNGASIVECPVSKAFSPRTCPVLQVLYTGEGLAIIDGLNDDAPIGTILSFVSGATGYAFYKSASMKGKLMHFGENDFFLRLPDTYTVSSQHGVYCLLHASAMQSDVAHIKSDAIRHWRCTFSEADDSLARLDSWHSATKAFFMIKNLLTLLLICSTLLWRRDDNLCYALLQGGTPEQGEAVMSKVKAIKEVMQQQTEDCSCVESPQTSNQRPSLSIFESSSLSQKYRILHRLYEKMCSQNLPPAHVSTSTMRFYEMQVVNEEAGLTTQKEYDVSMVPVGEALTGVSTDFLGRQRSETQQLGTDQELPLFNEQAPMDDREQIQEPLFTGLKVISCSHFIFHNSSSLECPAG